MGRCAITNGLENHIAAKGYLFPYFHHVVFLLYSFRSMRKVYCFDTRLTWAVASLWHCWALPAKPHRILLTRC